MPLLILVSKHSGLANNIDSDVDYLRVADGLASKHGIYVSVFSLQLQFLISILEGPRCFHTSLICCSLSFVHLPVFINKIFYTFPEMHVRIGNPHVGYILLCRFIPSSINNDQQELHSSS